jgi:hypothetical protein
MRSSFDFGLQPYNVSMLRSTVRNVITCLKCDLSWEKEYIRKMVEPESSQRYWPPCEGEFPSLYLARARVFLRLIGPYLRSKNLKVEVDPRNAGVLIVTLIDETCQEEEQEYQQQEHQQKGYWNGPYGGYGQQGYQQQG